MKMEGVLQLVYYPFFSFCDNLSMVCGKSIEQEGFVNLKNYFQNYMEVSLKTKKQKKICLEPKVYFKINNEKSFPELHGKVL